MAELRDEIVLAQTTHNIQYIIINLISTVFFGSVYPVYNSQMLNKIIVKLTENEIHILSFFMSTMMAILKHENIERIVTLRIQMPCVPYLDSVNR